MLDGEPAGVDRAELEGHLASCHGCRAWQERAHELTRRARLQSARATPVPSDRLICEVRTARSVRRGPPGWVARLGLVGVAAAQLAVSVPVLIYGHDREAPLHVAHEMGSFEVAIAVGFLAAAVRPGRAVGMLSVIGAAAMLLVLTAAVDLVANRTSLSDEAPHLLVVAGWLFLRRLAVVVPPTWDRPRSVQAKMEAGWSRLSGLRRRPADGNAGLEIALPHPGSEPRPPAAATRAASSEAAVV